MKKLFSIGGSIIVVIVFSLFLIKTTSSADASILDSVYGLIRLTLGSDSPITNPVKIPPLLNPLTCNPSVPGSCCPSGVCTKPPADTKSNSSSGARSIQPPSENTPPEDKSKLVEDRCFLITPGISAINGKMYGQHEVRAANDPNHYQATVWLDCGENARAESIPEFSSAKLKKLPFDKCTWAVDRNGHPARLSAGEEDELNFDIRKKQEEEDIDKFAVTMDDDLKKLESQAKGEIRNDFQKFKQDCPTLSNQSCDKKLAKTGVSKEPKQAQPTGPTREQHEQYWRNPGDKGYKLPPPGGTKDLKMRPKFCEVGVDGKPTCTSFDADKKTGGYGAHVNDDVFVTKDVCEFKISTAKPSEPVKPDVNPLTDPKEDPKKPPVTPEPPKTPPPSNGQQNPGNGQNPGGGDSPGGGQNPGGGQQQNPSPYPYYPSPTPPYGVACPQNYAPVCDVNGQTQANRCIAEQQKRVQVAREGECTANGLVVCPQTYIPVCDENNKTQPNQCVAEQQKKVKIKHTGACTGTNNSPDNITALSDLIKQVVTSGIPDNKITSVVQAIIKLFANYNSGTSSSNSP